MYFFNFTGTLSLVLSIIPHSTWAAAAKPHPLGGVGVRHGPEDDGFNPKLLQVQKAINQRYTSLGAVDYVPAPEDGKPSWETMYSLTQGLQFELGISPTVRNFGQGTFDAVKARGKLPGQEDPTSGIHFIRLYNAALWCKGYPASLTGWETTWDSTSALSFDRFWADIGLVGEDGDDNLAAADRQRLWPHVCRALFRMDGFRKLAPGGTEPTRQIQQWLNKRFVADLEIPAMVLVPTDGKTSQDTMVGLAMGLQYELGIPPDEITGNFGPKTQASLKALGPELTGHLRYIFRALCWFNSPTLDTNHRHVHYNPTDMHTDTVTKSHRTFLQTFQIFLQLTPSGTHDFATFAQLLVSVGDADRPATGGDCITEINAARGSALNASGYQIIGRYLDENVLPNEPGYLGKALKPHEPATILASGLRFFPIFQYGGRSSAAFSYELGRSHASIAHNKSAGFGIPRGTCIYFAVDYDASDDEIDSSILPYFRGVRDALLSSSSQRGKGSGGGGGGGGGGPEETYYRYGVYGSRNVCTRVSEEGGAKWSFVAGMAWGWSGNMGHRMPENWSLNQIKGFSFSPPGGGSEFPAFGLDNSVWRVGSDPGVSRLDYH